MTQKQLKYDLDKIEDMKATLHDSIDEMDKCKNEAIEAMDNLKVDWNTKAGSEFFNNVDQDWVASMNKFAEVIGVMEDLLEQAIQQYGLVEDELAKIKLEK